MLAQIMLAKKIQISLLIAAVAIVGVALQTYSHCQVPCGIYGDETRFTLLEEHIATIEKSMNMIDELSGGEAAANTNQIVRWVNNKEAHADELTHIVTYYFLAQRVKPAESGSADHGDYVKKLELLHNMMVSSMKCKQTTDLANTEKLKTLVADFKKVYFKK